MKTLYSLFILSGAALAAPPTLQNPKLPKFRPRGSENAIRNIPDAWINQSTGNDLDARSPTNGDKADSNPLSSRTNTVTVSIESGDIIGKVSSGVESFGGIPFADPAERLRPPRKLSSHLGTFDATGAAGACPQMFISSYGDKFLVDVLADVANLPFFQTALGISEDCLTISVQRPADTKAGDNLPVLFWIFGGGFEFGWSSTYDGSGLVKEGVDLGEPFIFIAVNYRVGGFGFMPGKEILEDGASNLGLLDQRMGLEWVADNIATFGGDPEKVTIWGQSAGAISVFDQMALYGGNATYKGKPLFRGAIMNSGSLAPADPVDCPKGQAVYDAVVTEAGCAGADDTLACLRGLEYHDFLKAANSVPGIISYHSVALSYLPRPDGIVLVDSPDVLAASGRYAAVPMIIGNQEDEGTLFSLLQLNVTSTSRVVKYLGELFFHSASESQLEALVDLYPSWLTAGSPFRTGILNEIYPGFKRLAAILGDLVFTLTRRVFLSLHVQNKPEVPCWSYLASYNYGTPILGTFHGSDLLQVFYGILPNYASASIQSYYINFVNTLDPNVKAENGTGKVYKDWPKWTSGGKEMMQFFHDSAGYLKDDFRSDIYGWIVQNVKTLYI